MAGKSQAEWVLQIGELLRRDDLQTALEIPTSIFKLPDSVTADNPDAYSPSKVLLGPYQDFKREIHKMEIFKLENAKKARDKFGLSEFNQMVDKLKELDVKIRSCYDRSLEMEGEALAWRMLIDGLFLFGLLGIVWDDKKEEDDESDRRFNLCLPTFGEHQKENKEVTKNEVIQDLLMLENQIPLHVLKRILPRIWSDNLDRLLYKFCASVSPLPLPPYDDDDFLRSTRLPHSSEVLDKSQHLLHFLYALIFYERFSGGVGEQELRCGGAVFTFLAAFSLFTPTGNQRAGCFILVDLLKMTAGIIRVGILQQLLEAVGLIQSLFGLLVSVKQLSSDEDSSGQTCPSAGDLKKVGVKINYKMSTDEIIGFNKEKTTLKLPIITINAFSQVIFRNLLAFEAAAKFSPPYFSNYVTLMSGLVASEKDVKILKQSGIIQSHSGGDEDVLKLFKALGNLPEAPHRIETDEPTNDDFDSFSNDLELRMIEEIKEYYESRWRVKVERFAQRRLCPVFQILIILFVVLLMAIVAIRTVCGWFDFGCPKIFGHNISATTEVLINGGYYAQ